MIEVSRAEVILCKFINDNFVNSFTFLIIHDMYSKNQAGQTLLDRCGHFTGQNTGQWVISGRPDLSCSHQLSILNPPIKSNDLVPCPYGHQRNHFISKIPTFRKGHRRSQKWMLIIKVYIWCFRFRNQSLDPTHN